MKLQVPERKRPIQPQIPENEELSSKSENAEALSGDLSPVEEPPKGQDVPAPAPASEGALGPILTDAIQGQPKVHLKAPSPAKPEVSEPASETAVETSEPKRFKPGAFLAAAGVAAVGLAFAVFGAAGPGVNSGRSGSGQPASGAGSRPQSGSILIE